MNSTIATEEPPDPKPKRTAHDAVKLVWTCNETGEDHEIEFPSTYQMVCFSFSNLMTHDEVKRARTQAGVVMARNLTAFRDLQRGESV